MRSPTLYLVAAVALIASCSADDDAETLPEITSTASLSASTSTLTSSSTPEPTGTAALETEVTAFFEDYIDTVDKSWTSEKALEQRRTMFKDSCNDCLAGYLFAKRAHAEALVLTGDHGQVVDIEILEIDDSYAKILSTEYLPERDLVDQSGNVVREFEEYKDVQVIYELSIANGTWVIVDSEAT